MFSFEMLLNAFVILNFIIFLNVFIYNIYSFNF